MFTYKNVTDKTILIWDRDLIPIRPNQIFVSFSDIRVPGIAEITKKVIDEQLVKYEEESVVKKRKPEK